MSLSGYSQRPKTQSGSMLVIAIFVMLVLTLLVLAIMRMLSASSDAVVHEVYGFKALNAAQSGLEEKIAQVFPIDNPSTSDCSSTVSRSYENTLGLEQCSVVASCDQTDYTTEGVTYYRFVSVGTCTIGGIITSRTLAVDAREEN